jgi:hypothetical protein
VDASGSIGLEGSRGMSGQHGGGEVDSGGGNRRDDVAALIAVARTDGGIVQRREWRGRSEVGAKA